MPTPSDPNDLKPAHPKGVFRSLGQFFSRDGREHLWAFLDHLDARPALKKALCVGTPALIVAGVLGVWGYQHWSRTNALRIARQWLDADRLDRASIAVQEALTNEADLPASWRLASELAWRMGNRAASVAYARKAALVSRYEPDDVLAWADAALLADDLEEARAAAAFLDSGAQASPRALRLFGDIARRRQLFGESRDRFQAALDADARAGVQILAIDEIPLGIVSLQTGLGEDRKRGQAELAKWATDPTWGADALRALLADAVSHREPAAAVRWASALRSHPKCTLGDVPVCLSAFAQFDPVVFRTVLSPLEEKSGSNPTAAAQLLGWLTQIGQGEEAVRWSQTLDPAAARKAPVAQGVAEALRATKRWQELEAWTDQATWGPEVAFLGWAYGFAAARQLGDGPKAESLWQSILADGRTSPAHALFLGDSLYAWGYPKESSALLWEAADRADLAYQAVGSLARLYQMQHDGAGEYRAFGRLSSMRPGDRGISNNYAYFAALTDLGDLTRAEHIAEDNFNHEPGNAVYRSTYAFVLACSGQAPRALTLMAPVARDWKKSPAIAFAYGAALAKVGRKSEAREAFDSLDVRLLSQQEIDWVLAALR